MTDHQLPTWGEWKSSSYDGPVLSKGEKQRRAIAARKRREKGIELTSLAGHSPYALYRPAWAKKENNNE